MICRLPCSTLFPYTTLFRSAVQAALAGVTSDLGNRRSAFKTRQAIQAERLQLPLFPTTTIGSFPQTDDIRRTRRRSEEHTSELQSRGHLVCRLLLEKKKTIH